MRDGPFEHESQRPARRWLQQGAEFVLAESGVTDDAAHGERVHRVVSGNRDDADAVGHHDVFALSDDPKAGFLESADGVSVLPPAHAVACPSPKPHPTRSGARRSVNPSTGPRPRAWLEVGRPASLDRRPCTVTPESRLEDGAWAGWAAELDR